MGISTKSLKHLWGRSGNRCAICRRELVETASNGDPDSLVGEACHIVAREKSGPRGNSSMSQSDRDEYGNLILLCNVHHKVVDDQIATYSVEVLHAIKQRHEKWVQDRLTNDTSAAKEPTICFRVNDALSLSGSAKIILQNVVVDG